MTYNYHSAPSRLSRSRFLNRNNAKISCDPHDYDAPLNEKIDLGGSTRNAKKVRIRNNIMRSAQAPQIARSHLGAHPRPNRPSRLSHLPAAQRCPRKSLRGLEASRTGASRRSRQTEVPQPQVQSSSLRRLGGKGQVASVGIPA